MARSVMGYAIPPSLTISSRRLVTSSDDANAQVPLGTECLLDDGRKYKYYNVREAIAIGQILTILNPDDADVDAAASDATLTGTGDFTANEFDANTADRREYYTFINATASPGQTRRIVSNTANILTVD